MKAPTTGKVARISIASVLVVAMCFGAAAQAHADNNAPATGAPTISGTPEVGQTLTVDVSGISDDDGLDNAEFRFLWLGDYDYSLDASSGWVLTHQNSTSPDYELDWTAAGRKITVEVSFRDDAGNFERLRSVPTEVVPGPITGITLVDTSDQSDVQTLTDGGSVTLSDLSGSYAFQVALADGAQVGSVLMDISTPTSQGESRIDDSAPFSSDGEDDNGLIGRSLHYGTYILHLIAFEDSDPSGEFLEGGEFLQGIDIAFQISNHDDDDDDPVADNNRAAGAPTISGTAKVGLALTADTSTIYDADGLANAAFSYQWSYRWLSDSFEISGATSSTYTPSHDFAGKPLKVTVSFTDDAGFTETLTSAETAAVAASNRPATGTPTISGTPQVGLTLTSDTSEISDPDGLTNATSSIQWQWRSGGTEISEATSSTYTPQQTDEGQTLTVTVSFTDDAGFPETLTSAETAVVAAKPNNPATGAPTINGTAQVGLPLTADTSAISDADGLDNAVFSYQWLSGGTEISEATSSTYTPQQTDEGQTLTVTVSFTDDAGFPETLTSVETAAVVMGGV